MSLAQREFACWSRLVWCWSHW